MNKGVLDVLVMWGILSIYVTPSLLRVGLQKMVEGSSSLFFVATAFSATSASMVVIVGTLWLESRWGVHIEGGFLNPYVWVIPIVIHLIFLVRGIK